jgi:hypothetical protein
MFDSLSGSDLLFYALMILLVFVTIVLSYLIYSQNKEMAKKLKNNSLFEEEASKDVEITKNVVKEVESLVVEEPQIVPITEMSIPDYLELTQSINLSSESEELQNITRELETLPKERKIEMTPFEAEQEETAIISYDELVRHVDDDVKTNNEIVKDDFIDKDVSIDVVLPVSNLNDNSASDEYKHEENFLNGLKTLSNMLRN